MKFQRKEELYVLEFDKKPKTIRVGEIDIPMPRMPAESSMVNYGIPVKDQKFVRRPVPKDIKFWEQEDVDDYVAAEWHRRRNGYWILIKGKPFYIPGAADLFFNFWTIELGGLPEFRMGALEWWWFWWNCERDPNCFGMLDIKCRRVGDTENSVCALWERSTRYKNFDGGIIHITEKGAKKNYSRLVRGNNGMPFFYRPINSGTDKAKGGELEFDLPEKRITNKSLKEGDFHEEVETGLGSKIYIEAAVTGAFDGVRLGTYYSDEIFKVKSSKFDVIEQWKRIKPVLSLKNNTWIVGKAIKTSTVEEMEDGATVDIATKLWADSNPLVRINGRTVSGLYRYFRGYLKAEGVDEWGFHKEEEGERRWNREVEDFRKRKDWVGLLNHYRQQPSKIEEALSVPLGECILYPEMCEERLRQLNEMIDRNGRRVLGRGEYGDLIWKNNIFGGEVVWVPNPAGKCFISQHPDNPNAKIIVNGKPYPANMGKYRMGADPFDSDETSEVGSDGAFYVKRLLNLAAEPNEIIVDEKGEIMNVEDMMTNQCVCDYTDRPDSPYDYYDYVYRACVYFGVAVYPEIDKPGLKSWMKKMGLTNYLQVQPEELRAASSRKSADTRGQTSTPSAISQYIDSLKMHICKYVWCCHHPRVLENWKRFTKKKRTKFDLAVSSGYAELGEFDTRYEKQEQKSDRWETMPFEQYEISEN